VWYIRSRKREVRWDKEKKKKVVIWSRHASAPSLSFRCAGYAASGIPTFTPFLALDIRRTYLDDDWTGWGVRCFFASNGGVLCVITAEHIYSWHVGCTDVQGSGDSSQSTALFRMGVLNDKMARKLPLSFPYLTHCCSIIDKKREVIPSIVLVQAIILRFNESRVEVV